MGPRHSTPQHHHHVQYIYQEDPATKKMLELTQEQLKANQEQVKELAKLVESLQKSSEEALLKAKQLQDP